MYRIITSINGWNDPLWLVQEKRRFTWRTITRCYSLSDAERMLNHIQNKPIDSPH